MHLARITVENFRGISRAEVSLEGDAVLLGDNNSGKSTLLEAVELAIGADRLHRRPVIDEHDFYGGRYLDTEIRIEVVIADLDDELQSRFRGNLEFWDELTGSVTESAPTPDAGAVPCVRVTFVGRYDPDEDDFEGRTWFSSPVD